MNRIVVVPPAWREGARLLRLADGMQTRATEEAALGEREGASNWLALASYVARHAAEHLRAASDAVGSVPSTTTTEDTAK